ARSPDPPATAVGPLELAGRSLRPESVHGLGVAARIVDPLRHDHDLGVLRLVVPHAPHRSRWDPHGLMTPELDDLVAELALELAADHEDQLLLGAVLVPVRPLAPRVLRHAPVGQCDLLRADRVRDAAHLARIVAEPVDDLL